MSASEKGDTPVSDAAEGGISLGAPGFVSPLSHIMPEWLVWSAWLEHAPFAAWLIEQARPRTVVELGTWTGFSYFVLCEAVERTGLEARCWAVDTWEGDDQTG